MAGPGFAHPWGAGFRPKLPRLPRAPARGFGLGSFSSGLTSRYPTPPGSHPTSGVPTATAQPTHPAAHGGYGGQLTDTQVQAQAAARAQALLSPQIQQIIDTINARGKQGAAALAALTGEYAKDAAGYAAAIPGIYAPLKSEMAAASAALADRIAGVGTQSGQALAQSLAQANVQGPSDINPAQQGQGAATAAYGTGISALDQMIANEAAASTYAAGEPSRAFAGGQQQLGQFQRTLANDLAQQTGALRAQAPTVAEQIAQGIYARQEQGRSDAFQRQQAAQQSIWHQQQVARQNRLDQQNAANTAYTKRQNALRVVGPRAPTTQGRKLYWDSVAAQRTQSTGTVYTSTPTGIKPVIDPATGRPQQTAALTASQQTAAERKREFNVSARAAGLKTQVSAETAAAKAQQAATSEQHRHQEASARINAELTSTSERIRHNKAIEQNAQASTSARAAATRARVAGEKRRAALTQAAQAETARHNRATEHTASKIDVTLSRATGQWVDSSGQPVPKPPARKPPPLVSPTTKKPVNVDLPLSIAAGQWVDGSGNAVTAPGLPPKPPAKKTGGSSGASGIPRKK